MDREDRPTLINFLCAVASEAIETITLLKDAKPQDPSAVAIPYALEVGALFLKPISGRVAGVDEVSAGNLQVINVSIDLYTLVFLLLGVGFRV